MGAATGWGRGGCRGRAAGAGDWAPGRGRGCGRRAGNGGGRGGRRNGAGGRRGSGLGRGFLGPEPTRAPGQLLGQEVDDLRRRLARLEDALLRRDS